MATASIARISSSMPPVLGPGIVLEVREGLVTLSLGASQRVHARMAVPYEPVVGDTLLVIGSDDHYVIGVLDGHGRHVMASQGDVLLHAIGGSVELRGDVGVRLTAPTVHVQAGALHVAARTVVEAFTTLHQRVSDLLSTHVGQSHTMVERESFTQARSAVIQTEETVTINGQQIHLG